MIKMETRELQRLSKEIVERIDKKLGIRRDGGLSFSQFIEECGELGKEVNRGWLRNEEPKKENLEDEFADVFLQLSELANLLDIDLEKSVLDKIEKLKERHDLN